MRRFVHETPPRRVLFGAGALDSVTGEVQALGLERVLVIGGGSAAAAAAEIVRSLGQRCAATFEEVRQHVPSTLATQAVEAAKACGADGLCSVGGGSATGLAKSVAVELGLPIVAVPTTYAGSEMTAIYGVTGEHKRTGRDPRAHPRVVIYDAALTVGLPSHVTAASGLNAMAHAVAALLPAEGDPVSQLHAEEAIRTLSAALPLAVRSPDDLPARTRALYGAFLAGSALAAGVTGLHHRLAHILGGTHKLVHADVHAVLLPHTVAYERDRGVAAVGRVSAVLGLADAAADLHRLASALGAPTSLEALGLPESAVGPAAQRAADDLSLDGGGRQRLEQLLADAYAGRSPRTTGDHDVDRDPGGAP